MEEFAIRTPKAEPKWTHHALDGAVLGALIWVVEALLVASVAADVGGLSLVFDLSEAIGRWGLMYAATGAALGLLSALRPWISAVAWGLLVVLGPVSVLPASLYLAAVLLGLVGSFVFRKLPVKARILALVTVVLAMLGPSLWPSPQGKDGRVQEAPHVVLVVVDALRADRVRPDLTPNISEMGEQGLVFTQARTTASWTLPAHASLFTGLAPSEHGAHAGHPTLATSSTTLAEQFADRGYRTLGLSANAWVSAGTGLDRGFSTFEFLGGRGIAQQLILARWLGTERDLGGQALTHRAIEALDQATADGVPLFLFINYLEAHEPLGTVPGFDPAIGQRWMRDMPKFWCACEHDDGDLRCEQGRYVADEQRISAVVRRYEAGVAYVDVQVGAIRQALTDRNRWSDAWMLVTSDHGEQLGEAGHLGHMVWLNPELERVPLVVHGPGMSGVDTAPISLSEVSSWWLAQIDGAPAPVRSAMTLAESHAHAAAKLRTWTTAFGCDYQPATVLRRTATSGAVRVVREDTEIWVEEAGLRRPATPEERGWVSGAFSDEAGELPDQTRRQLRALGYVE